jgi:hypothetical protein
MKNVKKIGLIPTDSEDRPEKDVIIYSMKSFE